MVTGERAIGRNYQSILPVFCIISSCLPTELFCDGHPDCADLSDEGWCDPEHDPNAAPPCDYRSVSLSAGVFMDLQLIFPVTALFPTASAQVTGP